MFDALLPAITYVTPIFRTIKETGELYEWLVDAVGAAAYGNETRTVENRMIEQYHSCSSSSVMDRVMDNFKSRNSRTRCLIATVAFGMGVDVPDIDIVVHWGVSNGIVQYWQEVGRCRRDGMAGLAVLYAYRRSLNCKIEQSFRELCANVNAGNVECLRAAILRHLAFGSETDVFPTDNCDRCCKRCTCKRCLCCCLCAEKCPCFKR